MTRRQALAGAARRVSSIAVRIPEAYRPDIATAWGELSDQLEDVSDRRALELIADWQAIQEERLCAALVHAPLGREAV